MNAAGPGDALIEALRDPAAYPHAVVEPVRVVETHISWVLLTGPYAYKIKKPLKLSFLDYSTPERRRQLCEEELRLNRRLAPDLYLDVVPIVRDDERVRMGADCGAPVEHAVRMRQFDTRDELDALIERDAAERTELARLGERLGHIHATAIPADRASDHGSAPRVQRITLDNFIEIESLGLPEPVPANVGRLRDWAAAEFARIEPMLQDRHRHGWIRECHGDLHCANVVRWRGALTPFDGIEFDPALRFIDVVNDLAFLTMDLAARGRADLRHAVLNAWTESLGDYASLPLLPYYEAYRALVRAKVAGLRTRQHAPGSQSSRAALADVQRYLDWALAGTRRAPPMLLITCGLSGSGKTWLARRLAPGLGALHVRSDIERKRLAGLAPLADSRSPPDAGLYTREFNTRTYARLAECAQACLQGGESVIVDAAFLRRAERSDLLAVGGQAGAKTAILHCAAPLDTLRARIASRRDAGGDASEADVSLLDRQPAYWETLADAERAVAIDVDTTSQQSIDECVDRLRRDEGS